MPITLFAQDAGWCGTDRMMQIVNAQNPNALQEEQDAENAILSLAASGAVQRVVHTIPVVFHIIHDNGVGDISKEQIDDALAVLNIDFNKTNHSGIRSPFQAYSDNCEVQFKLAQKDPNGNCTSGIIRVNAPMLTYDADDDCKDADNGGSDPWNQTKYMNIWVVNSIFNTGTGTILGYAYLPWSTGSGAANYGILIIHSAVGRIGTSSADGRTLTHEMGHALGLRHTFEGGCDLNDCSSGGDRVCDTPPALEATYGCSLSQNTCGMAVGSVYGSDVVDQIENYMSYDACQEMFTTGQKSRMKGFFSSISKLSNMTSSGNLSATGVSGSAILCAAEFSADNTTVCANQNVSFADESFNGVTTRSWVFTGGSPASSALANPVVSYPTAGVYSVELTAGNGSSSVSQTKTSYITVLPEVGKDMPFVEGFETIASVPIGVDWFVDNPDGDEVWQIDANIGYASSKSVMLLNSENGAGDIDALISGPVNLNYFTNVSLDFKYAFAKKLPGNNDELKIYVSRDCGTTWSYRGKVSDPTVAGTQSASWAPTLDSEWKQESKTIPVTYLTPHTRFKFEMNSGGGNNIYLDDINISGILGVSENEVVSGSLALYPNPTKGSCTLSFDMQESNDAELQVFNLLGMQVQQMYLGELHRGAHNVMINTSEFQSGIYLVQLRLDDQRYTRRLVVH